MNELVDWISTKVTFRGGNLAPRTTHRMRHLTEYHVNPYHVHFLAIGDAGNVTPGLKRVAKAMDYYARNVRQRKPRNRLLSNDQNHPLWSGGEGLDFVALLGDNFYPFGVEDEFDPQFDTTWRDIFIGRFNSLRIPWNVVLGNHDYMRNPDAQVRYSYCDKNELGLWNLPDRNYNFGYRIYTESTKPRFENQNVATIEEKQVESMDKSDKISIDGEIVDNDPLVSISESKNIDSEIITKDVANHDTEQEDTIALAEEDEDILKPIVDRENEEIRAFFSAFSESPQSELVEFFVLDTNACQDTVVIEHPDTKEMLQKAIIRLDKQLAQSKARWKIVFGHHPLYTQGRGHSGCARCLRDPRESFGPRELRNTIIYYGYGLEDVLVRHKIDAYFAGHEHVFQVNKLLLYFILYLI